MLNKIKNIHLVLFLFLTMGANAHTIKNNTSNVSSFNYPVNLDYTFKVGNLRDVSRLGILAPIYGTSDGLLYANIFGLHDSKNATEYNLGLGYRTLFSEYIVGSTLFYDKRRSNHNNLFSQLTLSLEYLRRFLEIRTNAYLPIGKNAQPVTAFRTIQTSFIKIQKPGIMSEKALWGFDVEAGGNMPHFEKLSGHLAYYHFNDKEIKPVNGVRFRTRLDLNDYVSLEGEVGNDRLRKTNFLAGISVHLPLIMKENAEVSALRKKMTQMVIRDIDIVNAINLNSYRDTPEVNDRIYVDWEGTGHFKLATKEEAINIDYTQIDDDLFVLFKGLKKPWGYIKEEGEQKKSYPSPNEEQQKMSHNDALKALGLLNNASVKEIRKAYRKAALQYHPDKNIGTYTDAKKKKFISAENAYEILMSSATQSKQITSPTATYKKPFHFRENSSKPLGLALSSPLITGVGLKGHNTTNTNEDDIILRKIISKDNVSGLVINREGFSVIQKHTGNGSGRLIPVQWHDVSGKAVKDLVRNKTLSTTQLKRIFEKDFYWQVGQYSNKDYFVKVNVRGLGRGVGASKSIEIDNYVSSQKANKKRKENEVAVRNTQEAVERLERAQTAAASLPDTAEGIKERAITRTQEESAAEKTRQKDLKKKLKAKQKKEHAAIVRLNILPDDTLSSWMGQFIKLSIESNKLFIKEGALTAAEIETLNSIKRQQLEAVGRDTAIPQEVHIIVGQYTESLRERVQALQDFDVLDEQIKYLYLQEINSLYIEVIALYQDLLPYYETLVTYYDELENPRQEETQGRATLVAQQEWIRERIRILDERKGQPYYNGVSMFSQFTARNDENKPMRDEYEQRRNLDVLLIAQFKAQNQDFETKTQQLHELKLEYSRLKNMPEILKERLLDVHRGANKRAIQESENRYANRVVDNEEVLRVIARKVLESYLTLLSEHKSTPHKIKELFKRCQSALKSFDELKEDERLSLTQYLSNAGDIILTSDISFTDEDGVHDTNTIIEVMLEKAHQRQRERLLTKTKKEVKDKELGLAKTSEDELHMVIANRSTIVNDQVESTRKVHQALQLSTSHYSYMASVFNGAQVVYTLDTDRWNKHRGDLFHWDLKDVCERNANNSALALSQASTNLQAASTALQNAQKSFVNSQGLLSTEEEAQVQLRQVLTLLQRQAGLLVDASNENGTVATEIRTIFKLPAPSVLPQIRELPKMRANTTAWVKPVIAVSAIIAGAVLAQPYLAQMGISLSISIGAAAGSSGGMVALTFKPGDTSGAPALPSGLDFTKLPEGRRTTPQLIDAIPYRFSEQQGTANTDGQNNNTDDVTLLANFNHFNITTGRFTTPLYNQPEVRRSFFELPSIDSPRSALSLSQGSGTSASTDALSLYLPGIETGDDSHMRFGAGIRLNEDGEGYFSLNIARERDSFLPNIMPWANGNVEELSRLDTTLVLPFQFGGGNSRVQGHISLAGVSETGEPMVAIHHQSEDTLTNTTTVLPLSHLADSGLDLTHTDATASSSTMGGAFVTRENAIILANDKETEEPGRFKKIMGYLKGKYTEHQQDSFYVLLFLSLNDEGRKAVFPEIYAAKEQLDKVARVPREYKNQLITRGFQRQLNHFMNAGTGNLSNLVRFEALMKMGLLRVADSAGDLLLPHDAVEAGLMIIPIAGRAGIAVKGLANNIPQVLMPLHLTPWNRSIGGVGAVWEGKNLVAPRATAPLGKWGESRLNQVLGGAGFKPTKGFKTSLGYRYVDRLVNGVAHEAKAGVNVKLTSKIRKQILKDVELIRINRLKNVHWHFFQGASHKTLEFLKSNGIKYTIH